MKKYTYEVFGKLENDIIDYCKEHTEISAIADFRTITFTSTNLEALEKLHDEFFNEYEFNVVAEHELNLVDLVILQ